jgi:hypothetical protein
MRIIVCMMFWKKKKAEKPKESAKKCGGTPTREEIIAKAKANMASAREEIGDETLEKIKEAMLKKQQSSMEQAKAKVKATDTDHVRDHLRLLIRD